MAFFDGHAALVEYEDVPVWPGTSKINAGTTNGEWRNFWEAYAQ